MNGTAIAQSAQPYSLYEFYGTVGGPGGSYIPAIDPTQIKIDYIQPGTGGVPLSTGNDPQDSATTAFPAQFPASNALISSTFPHFFSFLTFS